jgi:hypothetical protein
MVGKANTLGAVACPFYYDFVMTSGYRLLVLTIGHANSLAGGREPNSTCRMLRAEASVTVQAQADRVHETRNAACSYFVAADDSAGDRAPRRLKE